MLQLPTTNNKYDAMEKHERRDAIVRCLANLGECLCELSLLWDSCRRSGDDVSDIEILVPTGDLQAIAEGAMLPEVFTKLGMRRQLKRIVAGLPPSEQKRLVVDGESIVVATREPDGTVGKMSYPVERLPQNFVRQVFDYRRIRTYDEQKALPPEPVTAPRIDNRPVELESLIAAHEEHLEAMRTGDKRQRRKAVKEGRETWEKIALLVQ